MTEDEEGARPTQARLVPLRLDGLAILELKNYISELEAEIFRAKAAIAAKQDHRSAADAFFRKP